MANEAQCYQLPIEDAFNKLSARSGRLSSAEATDRLQQYGPNEIRFKKPSVLMRFLRQFNNPLVYVLLVAAGITVSTAPETLLEAVNRACGSHSPEYYAKIGR